MRDCKTDGYRYGPLTRRHCLLDGKKIGALVSEPPTRAALERFLEILSEASRHIPEEWKTEFTDIPWRQVADLGNFIRHAYYKIDLEILWSIYENDLHSLELVAEKMIARCQPKQ
ncbi:MAG: DUF86 domain-containing protein [Pseudolabrys sp.]